MSSIFLDFHGPEIYHTKFAPRSRREHPRPAGCITPRRGSPGYPKTKTNQNIMAGKDTQDEENVRVVCRNRKARHLYHIIEEYEAGLVLTGTEVKSLRQGKASLPESYAQLRDGEIFLVGCHIDEYGQGNRNNHDPMRERKLLLNSREITRLQTKVLERGFTLVPLSIYFRDGWAKVKIALARGKKLYDKREDLKKRTAEREAERAMRKVREM